MSELLAPFTYDYMVKAIWVSALVGGICAFLSAFLMLKGWSLMGDALAHSIVPGVAVAYLLKLPYAVGAFFAGLLAALGMAFVRQQTRLREDAVIGIVFTAFFAAGLLLVSLYPTSVNVQSIVLGNILGISDEDVLQVVIICAVTLTVLLAQVEGPDAGLLRREPCALPWAAAPAGSRCCSSRCSSAATVAALQTVGACLVIAMVVTPGATAYLLTDRFGTPAGHRRRHRRRHLRWSAPTVSYFLDGATGGVIVTLQTLVFLAAFFFAPKHGLLAARRRRAPPRTPRHDLAASTSSSVPLQLRLHAARAGRRGAGGRRLRRALLLPGAQGLVADGRRHLARGAARHRAGLRRWACRSPSAPSSPACSARWPPATSRTTAA